MEQRDQPKLLTADEAADLVRVHSATMRRRLNEGWYDAFRTGPGGHWRIRVDVDGMPRLVLHAVQGAQP